MHQNEFGKFVEEGYTLLPEWVRQKVKNVAVLVEDAPSKEVRKREGLEHDETLLGYYQGIPLTERGDLYGVGATMPDTITLYKKPILEEAGESGLEVSQVIAETIWHEFAQHFGMDEHEVQERENKR